MKLKCSPAPFYRISTTDTLARLFSADRGDESFSKQKRMTAIFSRVSIPHSQEFDFCHQPPVV